MTTKANPKEQPPAAPEASGPAGLVARLQLAAIEASAAASTAPIGGSFRQMLIRWSELFALASASPAPACASCAELLARLEREDQAHGQTIEERDDYHDAADKLAYAIADQDDIGEHTSNNDPWENAIGALEAEREAAEALQQAQAQEIEKAAADIGITFDMLRAFVELHPDDADGAIDAAEAQVKAALKGQQP